MLKTKRKVKTNNRQSGYTFLEILVVLIVIGVGLTAVATNMSAALATMTPEETLVQTANLVLEAKSQALLGTGDKNKLTFNINSVSALNHNGVAITTLPDSYGKGCESASIRDNSFQETEKGQQNQSKHSFCVSGKPFHFNSSESFVFDRFSGKTTEAHVFFFSNNKRKLALLITQTGDLTVAEKINDVWRSRTDIQKLYSQTQLTKANKENQQD